MEEDILDKVIEYGKKYNLIDSELLVVDDIEEKLSKLTNEDKNKILNGIYSEFVY